MCCEANVLWLLYYVFSTSMQKLPSVFFLEHRRGESNSTCWLYVLCRGRNNIENIFRKFLTLFQQQNLFHCYQVCPIFMAIFLNVIWHLRVSALDLIRLTTTGWKWIYISQENALKTFSFRTKLFTLREEKWSNFLIIYDTKKERTMESF